MFLLGDLSIGLYSHSQSSRPTMILVAELTWDGITNIVHHVSDGSAQDSAVLYSFTRDLHPVSLCVTKDRGADPDKVLAFVRVSF